MIQDLRNNVSEMFKYEGSGHDIYHLNRVYKLALHLQEREKGDRLVIGVSAFLHDIHRLMQNESKKYCSPEESLPRVKSILDKMALPNNIINNILHCIKFHEEYGFSTKRKSVSDIETLILQDADNLDAMGYMGIARAFYYSGANGVPIYLPEVPFNDLPYDETYKDVSIIHHFHNKLLKLKDNMNTETAKSMALKKHQVMEDFFKEFLREWNGEFD